MICERYPCISFIVDQHTNDAFTVKMQSGRLANVVCLSCRMLDAMNVKPSLDDGVYIFNVIT